MGLLCSSVLADTSVEVPGKFDTLVPRQDARAMGLGRANEKQRKAFEAWAIRFAASVAERQKKADDAECIEQVRKLMERVR